MGIILLGFPPDQISADQLKRIRAIAVDRQVVVSNDRQTIEHIQNDIEIAATALPLDLHLLVLRGEKLKWVQQWGAGVNWIMQYPELIRKDFILTNVSGIHAIPISEQIVGYLLAFARSLHHAIRAQGERGWWKPERSTLFELAGKTMLIIGTGAIGARTAYLAQALDMRVLGVRRNPEREINGVEAMFAPDQLLELLPEADFVVLTIPLTQETKGMIGEPELRAMKSNAYILNIGRGGTIQEKVLVRALQKGWIAGAGLDVFEKEPLPEDSPLWDMDNVIITAHYSGSTPHYNERAMRIFTDNLRRYMAGEPLKNVVDKKLGY